MTGLSRCPGLCCSSHRCSAAPSPPPSQADPASASLPPEEIKVFPLQVLKTFCPPWLEVRWGKAGLPLEWVERLWVVGP